MTPIFDLDSSLTISDVFGLRRTLLELLRSSPEVALDGSNVEQVDCAGIQLLAVFFREAVERQLEIRWRGVSDQLRSSARQLGLDNLLQLGSGS